MRPHPGVLSGLEGLMGPLHRGLCPVSFSPCLLSKELSTSLLLLPPLPSPGFFISWTFHIFCFFPKMLFMISWQSLVPTLSPNKEFAVLIPTLILSVVQPNSTCIWKTTSGLHGKSKGQRHPPSAPLALRHSKEPAACWPSSAVFCGLEWVPAPQEVWAVQGSQGLPMSCSLAEVALTNFVCYLSRLWLHMRQSTISYWQGATITYFLPS